MFDKRVGWFILALLTFSLIYSLRPFINGFGCNFSFVAESEHVKQIGKCKAGILTTYYEVVGAGTASYNRYVYGVDEEFIYAFRVNKERVDKKYSVDRYSAVMHDYQHAIDFYDGDRFYILKYKCVSAGKCFVMSDNYMDSIYEVYFDGRFGLF